MKRAGFVLIISFLIAFSSLAQAVDLEKDEKPIRVLFIGNSYTYFNNLPGILSELSRYTVEAPQIEGEMVVRGGASLKDHWDAKMALERIKEGGWDYVVLQDQSQLGSARAINGLPLISDPGQLYEYSRLFHSEIKQQGAKTVFMLTWARKFSPQFQPNLTHAYMTIGKELNAIVAPVGMVLQEAIARNPDLEIYYQDGSHLNLAGSYLAACVLYTAITGKDPISLPNQVKVQRLDSAGKPVSPEAHDEVELNEKDAGLLKEVSWATYRHLEESGGYISAVPVPMPEEPQVPEGVTPSDEDLIGTWKATAFIFQPENPANLLVKLHKSEDAWLVHLDLDFTVDYLLDQSHEIDNLVIADSLIKLSHPLKLRDMSEGLNMEYELSFTGDSLSGVARVFLRGRLYGVSSIEFHRAMLPSYNFLLLRSFARLSLRNLNLLSF